MSARPTHDLCIKTGTYTDRNTGQEKGRWLTIGAMFEHDDGGTSIKLDCVPVGLKDWEGWVSVFQREERPAQSAQAPAQQHQARQAPLPVVDYDDDIPF